MALRKGDQVGFLKDESNMLTSKAAKIHGRTRTIHYERAADANLPRSRRIDEPHGCQKCRFPGTARSQQGNHFTTPDLHAGIAHGHHFGVAAAVDLADSDRFNGQFVRHSSLSHQSIVWVHSHGFPDAQQAGKH